jgi:regulator of sigma E protease
MTPFWYALWFLVAVSLLVTVHEFGHFWVARRLGFKVLRFSWGFGTPLFTRIGRDGVEFVVSAIPLGGYVKMLDEREGPVPAEDLARSFTRRPPWQRILVMLAGPACNFLFAILVLWGMLWTSGLTEFRPVVGEVTSASVAARAGLRPGDEIRALDGRPVSDASDVAFGPGGLLDAMSARGEVTLSVAGKDGMRAVTLSVPDPAQRKHLTEPDGLFRGLGFEFQAPPTPPLVGEVVSGGAAAHVGLKVGDRIVAIGQAPIKDFRDIYGQIGQRPDQDVSVTYERGGVQNTVAVHIHSEMVGGKRIGRLGVGPPRNITYPDRLVHHTQLGPLAALGHATERAWDMTVLQARLFWRMVLGHVSFKNLSGPLSIAQYAGESAEAGPAVFLSFLITISLSLGFLNLLPIPILDGGQIAMQLVEWLKGSPLSERAQLFGQQIGFALLILLMGVALFNDIARQLG